MNTIETMIDEYTLLKKERDMLKDELNIYKEKFNALSQQLGISYARLLNMKVVSCEIQQQAWNFGKQVVYIALEDEVTEKGV